LADAVEESQRLRNLHLNHPLGGGRIRFIPAEALAADDRESVLEHQLSVLTSKLEQAVTPKV
jgi:hypothetical protein